jgi:alkanesulfonate monooxygenase SsuD/methylene tetrahydromethanopterin reductase-like flavin-dependent oxidoreductase (luciferase family)
VTPRDPAQARGVVEEIRALQATAGRTGDPLHLFGDLVVFLDEDPARAAARKAHLDERAGLEYSSDAHVFVGSADQLADLLQDWQQAGLSGFRLRPGTIPHDLEAITRRLVPQLQRRGVFRRTYEAGTLRDRLGLSRPANRYAAA